MKQTTIFAAILIALLFPAARGLGEAVPSAGGWSRIDEGKTGDRTGSVLLWLPDMKRMLLLGGEVKDTPFVQTFDPSAGIWSDPAAAASKVTDKLHPYYQAAYDPGTKSVYCLSGDPVLRIFNVAEKTWKAMPAAAELEGMSWYAMACDPIGKQLIVVGADKKAGNIGWMRTVIYNIPDGKWTRLDVTDAAIVKAHQEIAVAKEATIDLVGRVRLGWYRDPKGVGTDDDLKAMTELVTVLKKQPRLDQFAPEVDELATLLAGRKTLDALKAARALQRKIEEAAEAQYPVPCSRRNSPLVFDEANQACVLFGGDHEDYLMNDTWVLDMKTKTWRRANPDLAPSPRAGHAMCYLPKSGKVALYEGYVQSNDDWYGVGPRTTINPLQLWIFDVKSDRWDLVARTWPPDKDADAWPVPMGRFDGYSSEWYSPAALAADAGDQLILAAEKTEGKWKRPSQTWKFQVDPSRLDAEGRTKLGAAPNSRLARKGIFLAEYGEVPDAPKPLGLDKLPENQWVKLPAAPRNPCVGCRGRDWGTSVWDSDRDQILLWGGGHCVRSASTVAHWSPASGRIVEGYDADEPYGGNGSGGFDSSLLNRPWVSVHNYNHYAYDPKCKLLVSGRGYLYDPQRMDWVRQEPYPLPYKFGWGNTVVETSPHGAVAWAMKKGTETFGLWLFDRAKGWVDLQGVGKLGPIYCDANGAVYDSKRDRMIFSGVGGGYMKKSNGQLQTFDFKTKAIETITPDHAELAKTGNARELAYVEGLDWVLIGEQYAVGDEKTGKRYTRVYDCEANSYFLIDAGPVPDGYRSGWMYDAGRKLVYAFTTNGVAWALRLEPKTMKRITDLKEITGAQ